MKVALVYDRVNKWGGAERLLLALHELFPKAPLYTSVYNPPTAKWAQVFDIKTSFLQNIAKARKSHELFAALMPLAFESFNFDEFDLVISVTSEAAKGIITNGKTKHVCYCLTPTRYLWSGHDEYFKNKVFKLATKPLVSYLKSWDKKAAHRPDHYIAISQEVKKRIKKYYEREAEVIYPPLVLSGPANSQPQACPASKNNYFLIVSRLVPYKKIDIAIKAFNYLELPLKIAGTGSQEKKLKKMAGPNIEFLGNLTDEELLRYYRGCLALVFPSHEDFGLVMIESLSVGKPVIAFGYGGALEIVLEGKTGEFFYKQNEKSIIEKLKDFNVLKYKEEDCIRQAKRFSRDKFKKDFMQFINGII